MNDTQISSVLQQLREVRSNLEIRTEQTPQQGPDFGQVLKSSLDQVSQTQAKAGELATRFELADPSVTLPEVMVAMEKASVSFEAVKQVRNRVVSAYQEIMNMPI